MIGRWRWIVSRLFKRLWFRATIFSALGVLGALLAVVFKGYVPLSLSAAVGSDAVDKILGIIASSMLAVTTFSLSTMVSAYSAASSGVTPRATTLVMEDSTTQNALATFIGSFLFSLAGIIALSTGAYGSQGRVLLFGVTILVIMVIVYTLLRWIDHLSKLGRMGETIDRVENAVRQAILLRSEWPNMGAQAYPAHAPEGMTTVAACEIGYIQHIDVKALEDLARQRRIAIYLPVMPGTFIVEGEPLALLDGTLPDEEWQPVVRRICAAMTIDVRRTFEHDPRFGLSVLSEIASRALSPAVNDPGTAIDVITRGVRSLASWNRDAPGKPAHPPACAHVFMHTLSLEDMFADFFAPIARDGAGLVEIGVRMLKALASLAAVSPAFRAPARAQARLLLAYMDRGLPLDQEKRGLHALATELGLQNKPD